MFLENFLEKREIVEERMRLGMEYELVYSLDVATDIPELVLCMNRKLRDKAEKTFHEAYFFEYFDTTDDDILSRGWTFRCVSGFKGECFFRYDLKCPFQKNVCRETETFVNVKLPLAEIKEAFDELNVFQGDIITVALSNSYHIKWLIGLPQDTLVEVSLDIHSNPKTMDKILIDVEFEIKRGVIAIMNDWVGNFVSQNYPYWRQQGKRKYFRIREYYKSLI